ncbi:MAG TPA: ATP-binding protein [Polyangiaceae bacterium]|nr:ATP-binding protein [Polyangiaceae bacterium]
MPASTETSAFRPKILAVDDIGTNLSLLQGLLEPLDCELMLAMSGEEALGLLERHEFAVLLLDVQMPVMDGYELAVKLRSKPQTREVPIIFLTAARLDTDHVHRGYGSGAVDFLFKPLDATILQSKVQVFLELHASNRRVANAKRDLERAYEELKATQAQLVQAAKMASLGELVTGIAHGISNPLAFSLSHLVTARKSFRKAEESPGTTLSEQARAEWTRGTSRLDETSVGLERIRDLVLKLRVFSHLDEGEWKSISIRDSVESVLTILGHRLVDGVVIHRRYGEPERVACYPGLLNQAIMNIIANALDAIGDEGTVDIRAEAAEGLYVIRVGDSGPGIPPDIRERVLEPFFTTKASGQRTGLGLSISHSIMRKHGGTLTIECPSDGGTVVVLALPLHDRSFDMAPRPPPS